MIKRIRKHICVVLFLIFAAAACIMPFLAVQTASAAGDYGVSKNIKTKISAPATIVRKINTKSQLDTAEKDGVQVAVFDFNKDMNVVLEGGNVSISEADRLLGNSVIALKLKNEEDSEALINYLKKLQIKDKIFDIFFVSDNMELLKTYRKQYTYARAILDLTGKEIANGFDITSKVNSADASIALIDESQCSLEIFEYCRDAYTTLWVETQAADTLQMAKIILLGVHGIVSNQPRLAVEFMEKFNDLRTVIRRPAVVGHRGASLDDIPDPSTSMGLPENSMAAFKFAYENSADLIELDVQLTSDKKLVIMHDSTLNRTLQVPPSEGTIQTQSVTLEKIQSYKYSNCNSEYSEERVPSLNDVFKEFKGKDVRILIELKENQVGLAKATADLVKAEQMQAQVSFISFHTNQIADVKQNLPECSAGYLTFAALENDGGSVSIEKNLRKISELTNAGLFTYAPNTGLYNEPLFKQQSIRGILFNGWTYVNPKTRIDHVGYGVNALTVDVPQWFNEKPAYLKCDEAVTAKVGGEIDLDSKVISYNDSELAINVENMRYTVISGDSIEVGENGLKAVKSGESIVVARYRYSGYTIMGNPVVVSVEPTAEEKSGGCGNNITISTAAILASAMILAISVVWMRKRKSN